MLVVPSPDSEDERLDEELEAAMELPIASLRLVTELTDERDGVPPNPPAIEALDGGDPPLYVDESDEEAEPGGVFEADPDNTFDAGCGFDPAGALDPEGVRPEIIADDAPGGFAPPAVAEAPVDPLSGSEAGWPPPDAVDWAWSLFDDEPAVPGVLAPPADAIGPPEIEPPPPPPCAGAEAPAAYGANP